MNRTLTLAGATVTVALLLAACSGGDDDAAETTVESTTTSTTTSSTTTTVASTTTSSTTSTTVPAVLRMPLTGEPVDKKSDIPDRPALVVKISNAGPSVHPQAGLNQADLVIEEVINDQATRLAAVFHSQGADPVGPIRSGRAQDINLLLALNKPLFAWSGGNGAVTAAVRDSDLVDLSALHSSGYYRRSGKSSPNNLYSSTDALFAQAPKDAERPPVLFQYLGEDEPVTGSPATEIDVKLDSVDAHWEYDKESGRYYRWQDGEEHNTENGGEIERIWADNVVVYMADYGRNTFDGNPDAQVLGSNPVFIFTGGKVRSGTWLRFKPTDTFLFIDSVEDLNPLGLQPGRTWMEIPRNTGDTLEWS